MPVVLLALAGLIAGAGLAGAGKKGLVTPSQLHEPVVVGSGLLVAVVVAGFATMHVAGRYRHRTITQRLLASPHRRLTLGADLLLYGGLALVVGTATLASTVVIADLVIAGKHLSLGFSVALVLGVLLAAVLFAALGVAVGVITRSQPAAIVVLVGAFPVEKLLGEVFGNATAYLPYELLGPLLGLPGASISRGVAALTLALITAGWRCSRMSYSSDGTSPDGDRSPRDDWRRRGAVAELITSSPTARDFFGETTVLRRPPALPRARLKSARALAGSAGAGRLRGVRSTTGERRSARPRPGPQRLGRLRRVGSRTAPARPVIRHP